MCSGEVMISEIYIYIKKSNVKSIFMLGVKCPASLVGLAPYRGN